MRASRERSLELLGELDRFLQDDSNWGKNRLSYVDVRGHRHYCLVGAGRTLSERLDVPQRAFARAMRAVRRAAGTPSVRWFNDRGSTSIQDVRRVLKESIAAEHGYALPDLLGPDAQPLEAPAPAREERPAPATTPATVWTAKEPAPVRR